MVTHSQQYRSLPHSGQTVVARQPIFDRDSATVAYELLYRDSTHATAARFNNHTQATNRLLRNVFQILGAEWVVGDKLAFVNVSTDLLESNDLELLHDKNIVIEILETVLPSDQVIAQCNELHVLGIPLALDDFVYRPELEPLLILASYVKLDIQALGLMETARQLRLLAGYTVQVVAEKVETCAEYEACHQLGIDYFQGHYFAYPEIVQKKTGCRRGHKLS